MSSRGFSHNRASNGDALLLATRQLNAAAADLRVEALGQGVDELQRSRAMRRGAPSSSEASGLPYLIFSRHRARKERRLLTHESDR